MSRFHIMASVGRIKHDVTFRRVCQALVPDYQLDIRQLQCLVEFVRVWHLAQSLLSTIALFAFRVVCSIGVTQQRPESYPAREEVSRSQSVKSASHRVFRASDLTVGEVLGRGFYGQAVKVKYSRVTGYSSSHDASPLQELMGHMGSHSRGDIPTFMPAH